MYKTILKTTAIITVAVVLAFFIYKGTQNKVDPLWCEIDSVFVKPFYSIEDNLPLLDSVFYAIQPDKSFKQKNIHAVDLIKEPFIPIAEINKFTSFLTKFYKDKRVIASGISGAGKSTICGRITRLMAADTSRILYLKCVEEMSVEYHKQYIGYYESGKFIKGKLLDLFERCYQDTLHNYVFIVDDIDKIYPSTLFGSALWNEMDNPDYNNPIEGYTQDIQIPSNFFLLSVAHSGVGSVIEFNAEHTRRLSNSLPVFFGTSYLEYYLGMKMDTIKKIKKCDALSDNEKEEKIRKIKENKFDTATRDSIKRVLFFFAKTNQIIEEKYGTSYTLGQWSSIKKIKKPSRLNDAMALFMNHVNSFKPVELFDEKDFKPVFYSLSHNGLMKNSNVFYSIYSALIDAGLSNEIGVTIFVAIISAIYGITAFRKKKKFIKKIISGIILPANKYKNKDITYDEAKGTLLLMQQDVEQYTIKKKVNFSEANFLLLKIGEQLNMLDNLHQLNMASVELKKMFDEFMSDNMLNSKEYNILLEFLNQKRPNISSDTYNNLKKQIDDTYMISVAKTKNLGNE